MAAAPNVLPLFWNLASSSKDTRITASADLLSSLESFQQSYLSTKAAEPSSEDDDEGDGSSDEDEGDNDDGAMDQDDDAESGVEVDGDEDDDEQGEEAAAGALLDKALAAGNAEDVVYTVKRLVRGLGSSRESSRLGFAVALTELMARIPTVSASQVVSLVIRSSPHSKSMKGSEERDALFARLFGLTAVINSGALFHPAAGDDFLSVLRHLVSLGKVKAWLRESAWWAIMQAIERLCEIDVDWKDEVIAEFSSEVYENESEWTSEKVALTVLLEHKYPALEVDKNLSPAFKRTPLLNRHNLPNLARILKDSDSAEEDGASSSTGSWKPQLHFVWTTILDSYFSNGGATLPDQAPFQEFFRVCVDESLFANASSPERKYWGFRFFASALPLLPAEQMPLVFTPNFMRCWMNNLSSSDRYLHRAAQQIAKVVQEVIRKNPKVGFTLLSQLVGKHGRPDFDKVTKTKTVESIMGSLNLDGVKEYVEYLQGILFGGDESSDAAATSERRNWALDQILLLFRNGSVPKDDSWVGSTLEALLVYGFFIIRKADKRSNVSALHVLPKPSLSEATSAACRSRFLACIVEITTSTPTGRDASQSANQQGCDASGKLWLRRMLDVLQVLGADKHLEIASDADEEIKAVREEGTRTLQALDKVKDDELAKGVNILLTFLILQTYDENEDALEMLEDTIAAAQKMFSLSSAKASTSTSTEPEIDAPPIDMLLDNLVALLDKGSNDLRNLANLVVGMVSGAFTRSSIEHLVAQLEQTVAEAAANAEEEEDDEQSEDADASEDENAGEDEEDDDEEADEEEDDESDDDEEELPDVDPAFRKRVAAALQVSGMDEDGTADGPDSENSEDEVSEEELWDDEQMMKVDEQLAEVFRQQATTTKKSSLKHLRVESLHFKNRILDFFDVFARRHPTNPAIIDTLLPLLRLVRSGSAAEAELSNKAASILRARIVKPKDIPSSSADDAHASVLEAIHEMARKAPNAEFSTLASACSLFVVRSLDSSTGTGGAPAADAAAYRATLRDFLERKGSLVHPPFLADYFRRHTRRAWALRADLLDALAKGAVNDYRQTQGYALLTVFAHHLRDFSPSEARQFVARAQGDLAALLERAVAGETGAEAVSTNRLKEACRFALQLSRAAKNADLLSAWDAGRLDGLKAAFDAADKTRGMQGVRQMLAQLVGVVSGHSAKEGKASKASKRSKADGAVMDVDEAPLPNGSAPKSEKKLKAKIKSLNGSSAVPPTEGKKRKSVDDGEKKKKRPSVSTA